MIHLALTSGSDFGPKVGSDFAPKFGPSFKAQIQGVWGQIWWWKFVPGEVFGYCSGFHTCSMFHFKEASAQF